MGKRWLWLCLALLFCHCRPPVVTGVGPPVSIWPAAGKILPGTEITLSSAPGAQIYYTLDDTSPSPSRGYLYDGAFALWGTSTVQFVAVDADGRVGPVGKARFDLDIFPPLSIISPPSGNQRDPITVSFFTNADATVFYTLDGSEPSVRSRKYTKPFQIDRDAVVRFFAIDGAGNRELVQRAVYNFAPGLTVSPPEGLYPGPSLEITASSNEDALIQYRHLIPPGDWQDLGDGVVIHRDARIQIASTDLSGLSTVVTRDYGLTRPLSADAQPLPAPLRQEIQATALIDLEGLGQPRLLIATKAALYTLERAKDGSWSAPVKLADLGFDVGFLRIWDLDGDGLSDIMIGDTAGKLHLFQTLAATLIRPAPKLLGPWAPDEGLQMIVPIDADANGQLDVFLLDRRANQSRIVQRGSSGYLLPSGIQPPIEAGAVGALAADLDRDDDVDILILPGQTKSPYILVNEGKGGAGRFTRLSLADALKELPDIAWLHAARSDLDLDGDLDLLLVGRGPAPQDAAPPIQPGETVIYVCLLRYFSGSGASPWALETCWVGPDMPLRGVQLIDVDADGHDDLILQPASQNGVPGSPVVIKQFLGRRLFSMAFSKATPTWPPFVASTVADVVGDGRLSLLLLQPDKGSLALSYLPEEPSFLRLVIQGIRGNRNAIGAKISTRALGRFVRVREIGIRSTGPDQAELLLPDHYEKKEHIGTLTVRWPDGLRREIPAPTTNATMLILPP